MTEQKEKRIRDAFAAVARGLRRVPATTVLVVMLLAVGVAGRGLWAPLPTSGWWESVAYGIPAFREGRWWTPLTGTFFVIAPVVYIPVILALVGMALLEWKRGWRFAIGVFAGGQLLAVLVTAMLISGAALLPWPWAIELSGELDVGPSGGAMACIAACTGLLPSPWRQRLWVAVIGYAALGLLFAGRLADVEHAVAVIAILAVVQSFRIGRANVRERRQLAFAMSLGLGIVQVLSLLIPTNGPFGPTAAFEGPWIAVAIDAAAIILVTNGLRRGRRWAWIITMGVGALNILLAGLILAMSVLDPANMRIEWGDDDVELATSVLWLAFLVYLIAARGAFRSRRRRTLGAKNRPTALVPSASDARDVIRTDGGGTLSWMATWDGLDYVRTSTGLVPYQEHLGVAIVLADPLGAPSGHARSIEEFIGAAEQDALIPCFFSAGEATRAALPAGWRSLVIADDTIVDLPGLAFTGKRWSHVRTALNRGDREGVTFKLTTLSEETWGVRQQMRAISESWVGEKDLPEMRFTLGTLHEAEDPEVRVALALSAVGDVEGFLSWLPVYGPGGERRGWTLDLMRRREDGFSPVMEFLIGASARTFAEEGAQILSLSGAPLAHEAGEGDGQIARLLSQLSTILEPLYGFASLHRFKQKFNPRYEPIYLLYRDEGDLAAIGPALIRAFLPDATVRQFAGAGIDMVRHRQ